MRQRPGPQGSGYGSGCCPAAAACTHQEPCEAGPRVPPPVAATGPGSLRRAAEPGDGWVTYGGRGESVEEWFAHLAELVDRFDRALADAGRDAGDRYLSLDSSPRFSLESAGQYAELVGRAAELGFTDVVSHWPRAQGPYAGDPAVLEEVAGSLGGR